MHIFKRLLISSLAGLLLTGLVIAAEVPLKADHPDRYTVVKGDTLWDISSLFLQDPWRWSDIWYVNPQINNPHLIYPGDVLVLTYVNGKPRLQLQPGDLRLSPKVKSSPLEQAIPVIPIGEIDPFLRKPLIIEDGELDNMPYIVAFADEHVLGGAGQRMYVRQLDSAEKPRFNVVRKGGPYMDADTGEIIGYEAIDIAETVIQKIGDPATALLLTTEQEVRVGDYLVQFDDDNVLTNFYPKAPETDINGSVIDIIDGLAQAGQYNILALDKGADDGLKPGDVLDIMRKGAVIKDTVTADPHDTVKLPDEKSGLLMIFRTFDRVSYGIVLRSTQAVHLFDRVKNPQ